MTKNAIPLFCSCINLARHLLQIKNEEIRIQSRRHYVFQNKRLLIGKLKISIHAFLLFRKLKEGTYRTVVKVNLFLCGIIVHDNILLPRAGSYNKMIYPRPSCESVVSIIPSDMIFTSATMDCVISISPLEKIATFISPNRVIALLSADKVRPLSPYDCIIPAPSLNFIVT